MRARAFAALLAVTASACGRSGFELLGDGPGADDGLRAADVRSGDSSLPSGWTAMLRAPIGTGGALGAWSALPPLPYSVTYPSVVVHDARIYVIGGFDAEEIENVAVCSP